MIYFFYIKEFHPVNMSSDTVTPKQLSHVPSRDERVTLIDAYETYYNSFVKPQLDKDYEKAKKHFKMFLERFEYLKANK